MTEARAAVLRGPHQPFSVEDIQLEPPRHNEVLVQVVGTGICHTDVKMSQGYREMPMPVVLGHEGAGIVKAVGSAVKKVEVGDHVVIAFNSCGQCENCQDGHPAYCHNVGFLTFGCMRPDDHSSPLSQNDDTIHGYYFGQSSFSTMAITTERNVVKVDKSLPLEMLGPLGCGIQTGAGAVLNALKVEAGKSIAIFGTGSVGLSAVMAAGIAGATTIIAVDLKPERLEMAKELGATHTFNPADTPDIVAEIIMLCDGRGAHYSIDTTNVPAVVKQAFACIRIRGVYGHVGGTGPEIGFNGGHLLFGRTITGILQGDSVPDIFIPQLLRHYQQGRFPFDKLITFFDLDQINEAIHAMEEGKVIKPVLRMG